MMGAIAWRIALLVIAVVTVGVHLDRQAERTPALAQSVPELFRSTAQLPVTAYALTGEDPALAIDEAERLIRRRPLPAEHLRLLAQAQIAAGTFDQGALSIQYAAQRGWRDPLAQEAMLRLAIDAGDAPEAARRYAALFLRRDTQDALLVELGPPVLAQPGGEGRKTLIGIVSGGSRWHNQFLNRGVRVMPTDAFVEIVSTTIENGTRYDCAVFNRITSVMSNRDDVAGAELTALANEQC